METNGTKEKVVITDVQQKEYKGKTFYNVRTADGRAGSSNDAKLLEMVGKQVELEIKPAKMYNGVQQYYFNLPGENGAGGKKSFPAKDYTSDKRMNALTNAVASINIVGKTVTSENILALADKYFTWLNTK